MRVEIYGDAKRETVSGPTVQFTADDAAPVTDLKAQITPSIAGHSSVTITANGQNTSVSLTKPVYGGAVDVTTGVVTETHGGGAYNPTEVPTDLSSKIVSATTERSASGSVASFNCTLGEYPMSALTAAINPVQDLHGYSSPWPAGGGANLYPNCEISGSMNNLVVSHDAASETYSFSAATISAYSQVISSETFTLKAGRYYFDVVKSSAVANVYAQIRSASGATTYAAAGGTSFTLAEDTAVKARIVALENAVIPSNFTMRLAIASGSTAPTSWTPYSNICPISGWTECKVTRTGKNIYPWEGVNYEASSSRTTYLAPGNYILSTDNGGSLAADCAIYIGCFDANGNNITEGAITGSYFSLNGAKTYYYGSSHSQFPFSINKGGLYSFGFNNSKPSNINGLQLEPGSTTTSYEPYAGNTYSITFPTEAGTVYGGTLDVTQGKLTVDRAMVDLGTLTWASWEESGSLIFNAIVDEKKQERRSTLICSQYKPNYEVSMWGQLLDCEITGANNSRVYIRDQRFTDNAAFTTAMSGVQLVYELATPIEIQLDPVTISTISGQTNNVWADCGPVTVSYRDGLLSNVSGIMTNSTALTAGENITYTLSQERTFQIPGTVIRTVVGDNVMSASTGNISVTWSSHWFDITPWIAWQGLTFSRNDVDAPDAGRDMSGLMHRGRVGVKEKMNVQTIQLTRAQSSFLQTLLYPETIQVRVTPYPRTNAAHTMSMYTNNVKTTYVIHRQNGEDLQSLSFPLIEN